MTATPQPPRCWALYIDFRSWQEDISLHATEADAYEALLAAANLSTEDGDDEVAPIPGETDDARRERICDAVDGSFTSYCVQAVFLPEGIDA